MSDKSFTGLQLPNIGSGQARNPDSGFVRVYFKNNNMHTVLPNGTDTQVTGVGIDDLNNVVLTSPASGEVLKYNGTNWVNGTDDAGSGGSPGGSDTQIQFNSSGTFAGSSSLTWNGTTLTTSGLFTTSGASISGEAFFLDDVSFLGGATTRNVFNTTATTVNAFGASTSLTMCATTGTTTIRNNFSVSGNITVTGTVDGRDVAGDGTKLDGIEASADVTDAGNVNPLIDAHLNTSTAATNEVLSWDGADYNWVAQSGGGGGITTGKAIAMAIVFG